MKNPASRLTVRLAAKHATKIRKAFREAIDGDAIARAFEQTHPAGGSITPQEARDWAKINAIPDSKPLENALKYLYAEGWAVGNNAARYVLAHLIRNQKAITAPTVSVVNWATWKPGNAAASALLKPTGALQGLLDSRNIVIKEITNTKLNRIGTILSRALEEGFAPKKIAVLVDQVVDDPIQALAIAQTEMSRAVSIAQLEQYQETGIEKVDWLTADPCEICSINEDASPLFVGERWPSGDTEPPAHPYCMCDLAPVIDDSLIERAVTADIAKFVPSKLEAERALSRLKILPNPPDLDSEMNPDKYVESPWTYMPAPTVDPNVWDTAELALVEFSELTGTDLFLRRKKLKQHIESMGAATTPYRNFALVIERDGKKIIIDGHHRLMAMWLLGQTEAPVWLA